MHDYDYFDAYLPREQVRTTEILLGVIAAQKPQLLFRPGEAFEYNNLGFDLAALAAARAAGQPLAPLLDAQFFRPLGITSAFLRPGRLADFAGVRTLGYRSAGGKVHLHEVFDLEAFHGASNIYISARDLHRWNAAWMNRSWVEAHGLEPAIEGAQIGKGRSGLTLGSWYRDAERKAFSYAGHLQGFHSEVFRDLRSGLSIVYVSNNTMDPWLQHSIVRAIRAIAEGKGPVRLDPPECDEIRKEERTHLAAKWILPDGERVEIGHREGQTSLMRDGVRYRMVQVSPRFFYVPGLDFMIGFRNDPSGVPASMTLSSNFHELTARRIAH